jgi:hypothetical protein
MKRFSRTENRAYELSNAILDPGIGVTEAMRFQALVIEEGLAADSKEKVHDGCQELLNQLADAAGIPRPTFKLKDTAYAKFRGGRAVWKLYGTCERDGTITVAYKTAVRRKVFAFLTFFDTVVHEFMHHFDDRKLRLARSFHTRGFYLRVRALREALLSDARAAR